MVFYRTIQGCLWRVLRVFMNVCGGFFTNTQALPCAIEDALSGLFVVVMGDLSEAVHSKNSHSLTLSLSHSLTSLYSFPHPNLSRNCSEIFTITSFQAVSRLG